jgi:hypothetical protein
LNFTTTFINILGHAIAQVVSRQLPTVAAWVRAQVKSCEFVVEKVALGQVFFEYFDLPCQFSFPQLLYTHYLASEAGTRGQLVADVPSGLSLTPPQETKKKKRSTFFTSMINFL